MKCRNCKIGIGKGQFCSEKCHDEYYKENMELEKYDNEFNEIEIKYRD